MVVYGVRRFATVFTSGIESVIGKMLAARDKQFGLFISMYEWCINVISTVMFVSTAVLIVPFMNVYMMDITDTNYIQPILGYCIVLGSFFACIRLPYQSTVESAGHFRETRTGALVEATMNIVISLILIRPLGAVGVAIGTVCAMAFRTIQYALYAYKHLIEKSSLVLIKRLAVTFVNIAIIMIPFSAFGIDNILVDYSTNFFRWVIEGFLVFTIVAIISLLINVVSYRKDFADVVGLIRKTKKA